MTTPRRLLTAAATLAAATILATPTATAAPSTPQDTSALPCDKGYLCVYLETYLLDQIPEGESRTYTGLPITGLANATSVGYCVTGTTWYGIGPGTTIERKDRITSLTPTAGGYCLSAT